MYKWNVGLILFTPARMDVLEAVILFQSIYIFSPSFSWEPIGNSLMIPFLHHRRVCLLANALYMTLKLTYRYARQASWTNVAFSAPDLVHSQCRTVLKGSFSQGLRTPGQHALVYICITNLDASVQRALYGHKGNYNSIVAEEMVAFCVTLRDMWNSSFMYSRIFPEHLLLARYGVKVQRYGR